MTTLAERVPVDEITRQARDVHPGRALLTAIAAVLFAAGWVAAKTFAVLWLALVWSFTAVKVGWQEGHNRPAGPSQPR